MKPKRILLFAEAVTLAHVARPLVLAEALRKLGHVVGFACADRAKKFIAGAVADRQFPIDSIASERFLAALSRGGRIYDEFTLNRYVEDDLDVIQAFEPDWVIGDFRLSLSVSARVAGIPYAAVTNRYWKPSAVDSRRRRWPLPVLPFTRCLPLPWAQAAFGLGLPHVIRYHVAPMNRVRARHGLPPLRPDLGALYTDADVILYADPPIGETSHPPSPKERYIGPLLWSPPVATPVWWTADAPSSVPTVYVTMGSSGPPEALASILDTLAGFPVSVIASTAGAAIPRQLPHNARVAPYLPGVEASRRACLVICNGGSPTCHQALAQGVPVVGISTNMDQFLNMQELERLECGIALRSDRCTPSILRRAFTQALASETLRAGARRWQEASCGVSLEEELSLLVG